MSPVETPEGQSGLLVLQICKIVLQMETLVKGRSLCADGPCKILGRGCALRCYPARAYLSHIHHGVGHLAAPGPKADVITCVGQVVVEEDRVGLAVRGVRVGPAVEP